MKTQFNFIISNMFIFAINQTDVNKLNNTKLFIKLICFLAEYLAGVID